MGTLLFIFAVVFGKTNAIGPIFESIQPEIIVDNEEITIFVSIFSNFGDIYQPAELAFCRVIN